MSSCTLSSSLEKSEHAPSPTPLEELKKKNEAGFGKKQNISGQRGGGRRGRGSGRAQARMEWLRKRRRVVVGSAALATTAAVGYALYR